MRLFRLMDGRSSVGAEPEFQIRDVTSLEGDVYALVTGTGTAVVALQGRTDPNGPWLDLGTLAFVAEPGKIKRVPAVRLAPLMRAGVLSIAGSTAFLDLVLPE